MSRKVTTSIMAFVFAASGPFAVTAYGASHQEAAAQPTDPGIDRIITGTNRPIYEPVYPPAGADQADCPLCYHRALLRQGSAVDASQPFPGD